MFLINEGSTEEEYLVAKELAKKLMEGMDKGINEAIFLTEKEYSLFNRSQFIPATQETGPIVPLSLVPGTRYIICVDDHRVNVNDLIDAISKLEIDASIVRVRVD